LDDRDYATNTNLNKKQDIISDLATIRQGASKGATALQSIPSEYITETELTNKGYATTSALNLGLADKQNIISDLETIRQGASKGATALQVEKYTGTYSKPTGGIPKTYLSSAVQTSLGKADTALQSHQNISGKLDATTAASTYLTKTDASNTYLGKTAKASSATSADSATKATQDGSGNVITSTYATKTELSNKQDSSLKFTNCSASTWVADTTYADFGYRCDISCSGVTEDMYAEVVFDVAQATSGNYAPVCETESGIVKIWSSTNNSITIPVIIIHK
jgi:hypothetical protein